MKISEKLALIAGYAIAYPYTDLEQFKEIQNLVV